MFGIPVWVLLVLALGIALVAVNIRTATDELHLNNRKLGWRRLGIGSAVVALLAASAFVIAASVGE